MLIRIRKPSDASENEVTPRHLFERRREFIRTAAAGGIGAVAAATLPGVPAHALTSLGDIRKSDRYDLGSVREDELTDYEGATTYNNFYEFGTGKQDPSTYAGDLKTEPWTVKVEGHCANPGTYGVEDLIRPYELVERVYRLRCVEAWAMVVPWVGFPLNKVIKRLEPTSKAKYVAFQTLYDPEQMPGQNRRVVEWPYVEGLRMDEAMNDLTMLVVGMYGEVLPNQNGAPMRLVVPWKYGFKSIKSIVRISFVENEPPTTWNKAAPNEYGFYSNVNPNVDHPRWSQAKERMLGDGLFDSKKPTLMFNGYQEEVAHLYEGMDLKKYY